MLGERIALLRRGNGWSQAELSERLHVSASTIGMYEQGRREPSLEVLVKLAEAFGVSADYLLTGKPLCPEDHRTVSRLLQKSLQQVKPSDKHFSREELAVLFAAMLTEA